MGIFYYVRSIALSEDIPGIEEPFENAKEFLDAADRGYVQVWLWLWLYLLYIHFYLSQYLGSVSL